MQKIVLYLGCSLILLFLFCFPIYAQQSDSLVSCPNTLSNAIQINFINESAIYYQFIIADKSSIRLGLSLTWTYSDTKPSDGENYTHTTGISPGTIYEKYSSSDINNTYNVVGSALYMYQLSNSQRVQLKMGIGPALNYNYERWSSADNSQIDSTKHKYNYTNTRTTYGVGALLCFQMIIPIYSSFQLSAEYNLFGNYKWSRQDYDNYSANIINNNITYTYTNKSHDDSHGWQINLSAIKVGLIYCF